MITVQPLDQTVLNGGTAVFTVTATSGTTISYQWYKDSFIFDTKLNGQNSSTLTLNNASSLDAGRYYVEVKNAGNKLDSRKATLTLDTPPVANNNNYTVVEDAPLIVPAAGVLANDTDADGNTLTAQLVNNVTHGTLALSANGGFTYLPATNYNGSDSFTYRAYDGTATGNVATVSITITPAYDPVLALNDSTNTLEDASVTIKVLANDYNPDGLPLTITGTSTTNGTAAISGTNVIFRASTNFNGIVVFNYTVSDGTTSSVGKVTVVVMAVNDAPATVSETYTTLEDVRLTIATPGVLANDTDADGDALTAQLVNNVTHGTLSLNTNGGFTYLSATNYNGSDSFTYRAYDGTATGNLATVTINITAVNDAPVANIDWIGTLEDTPVTINVLTNDSDAEGTLLTITGTSTTNGTAVITGTNIVFTPSTHYNGWVVFSYTVSDGTLSATGWVAVFVFAVNTPPVAVNDNTNTLEDVSVTIPVLVNDSDADGRPLTITGTSSTNGTAVISGTNIVFTPSTNYNGTVVFSYTVSDGTNSATASVTVIVTPVNDAPVANNDAYTTLENRPLTIPAAGILTNDLDADGDPLIAVLVSNVAHGSLSLNADGGFTYTPATNYFGNDSFTYRAMDGLGTSAVATVTLTVSDNTPPSINSAGMTAAGFSFQLSVPVGRTYIILGSTNFLDWTPLCTNFAATGSVVFTDRAATNYDNRFYKAFVP